MNSLDSRDLEKRLRKLEDLRDEATEQAPMDEDEKAELDELEAIRDEVGDEWKDGVRFIPEDDFTDYCKELLEDIGDLPKDLPWYIVINWEDTADNLKADYSEVEYQGTTYLYRV